MEANRRLGTVKWFSRVKGYGFIAPDEEEREIFVHFSGIEGEGYRNLEKGQRVSFVIEDTVKGPQAVQVRDQSTEEYTSGVASFSPDDDEEYADEGDRFEDEEEDEEEEMEDEPPDLIA